MIYSYRRVSTDEQVLGPQAQSDAIQNHINKSMARNIADADFCDIGVSGSVRLADRPEGAKLLAAIRSGDVIVTAKLDRLFRSTADASTTLDDWLKRDIKLVSIQEGFDFTNSMGKFMSSVMAAFAELERDMIRQRTKAALAAKARNGGHVGRAPYGHTSLEGQMYVNHAEQAALKTALECRGAGMKLDDICAKLDKMGYVTRSGGPWKKNILGRILSRNLPIARITNT